MTIDWRSLCAELTEYLSLLDDPPHELAVRAQAAMAQPEPEARPAPAAERGEVAELVVSVPMPLCERNWDSILSPSGGYEMADDAALRDGAQLVNGEWWAPVFGCDSLESALARIRERLQRQAAPAPAEGEVAELVEWLRDSAAGNERIGAVYAGLHLTRAAALLERQAAPVPVAVTERPWEREGWCDDEGRCWCMSSLDGPPPRWWLVRPEPLSDGWVLPAHALPLPSPGEHH